MNNVIQYNKKLGQTPLEAINQLRLERPELKDQSITYAGRLDPMATGLLLLLVGDAVHDKQQYLDLPKTYQAKILLGVSTDSYDVLGLPIFDKPTNFSKKEILNKLKSMTGKQALPYPPFSSKPVHGKPLWQWAKDGKIDQIEIPTREMEVTNINLSNQSLIPWSKIYKHITTSIKVTSGDFRQPKVLVGWGEINKDIKPKESLQIVEVESIVSSGTYIRTLANQLGNLLLTGGLLLSLHRTQIGEFSLPKNSID